MFFFLVGLMRKGIETELPLYGYGFAHLAGLSNSICARQTTSICKTKRRHSPGKSFCDFARRAEGMI